MPTSSRSRSRNGDETRSWTPFWHGESTQFLSFNRNKRSLSLNLKAPEAVDIVLALARDADVIIESFRAGALERMGLGYEAVRHLNPDIIYCSISGYGRTGPLADKPGYDLLIQGYSSLMSLTGEPDGLASARRVLPVGPAGMMAYGAIVTALLHRNQTGQGQWLEASLAGWPGGHHELSRHRLLCHRGGAAPHGFWPSQPGAVPDLPRC